MIAKYGFGVHVTTKGYVYSYGVMIWEMLTRKKPIHNMFVEGMNLQKWVGIHFPNQVGEVVDRSLLRTTSNIIEEYMEINCVSHLVSLGFLCTKQSLEGQPTMNDNVSMLQNIRDKYLETIGIPKFL